MIKSVKIKLLWREICLEHFFNCLLRYIGGEQRSLSRQQSVWNLGPPRYVMSDMLLPEKETWLRRESQSSDGLKHLCWVSSVLVDYAND